MRHLSFAQYLCTFITIQHSSQAHPPTQPCFEHESCVCSMPSLLGSPPSIPPSFPVESSPSEQHQHQQQQQRPFPDPNRLAPEDAYYAQTVKARAVAAAAATATTANYDGSLPTLKGNQSAAAVTALRLPNADGGRKVRDTSRRRRRRKGAWKKLLWVKQSCTAFLSLLR